MAESKPLSKKQRKFVDEYLQCFNATEAARRAGYKNNEFLRTNASKLLQITTIREEIETRLAEVHMSADEALKLNADIARGDIAEMMDVSSVGFNLDMQTAKEKGMTKLIKRVKQKTTTFLAKSESGEDREVTELEIELYPADAAIERIMRAHGVFKDPGSKDNPIQHEHIIRIVEHGDGS